MSMWDRVKGMFKRGEAPALPPGVDPSLQEAMTPQQLQHLLRQDWTGEILRGDKNDPHRGAQVVVKDELTPWMVTITGAFNLYGQIKVYATEIDIRMIEDADDFLALVANLNKAFDEAAAAAKRYGV